MTDDELFTADMARLYAMADEVITALPSWEYQDWLDQWQLVAVRFDQL